MVRRPERPLVSVALATRDAGAYLPVAVRSILRQTLGDLELIVVDDGSTDETVEVLDAIADARLVVLRNETSLGLAASLNRALEVARGRYVARLDADDVALPGRLDRQLEAITSRPGLAVLGSGILELDDAGRVGRLHQLPAGSDAVRWHALFRTPFFHPSVLLDRELLDEHGLRYDETVGAAQDFELWTRVLAVADGANLREPLVLRRVHAAQVTQVHGGAQRDRLARVAAPGLAALLPELEADERDLAWRVGAGVGLPPGESERAADAFGQVLHAFELVHGPHADVRSLAARSLARCGAAGKRQAASLRPTLATEVVADRLRRRRIARRVAPGARTWVGAITRDPAAPIRVVVVQPEPTPYRSPLFDRIAAHEEIDLTVIYAAETVVDRDWSVEHEHSSLFLKGVRVPGARPLIRHDYPVTPGIAGALKRLRPDVIVVTGWSMFASQAAITWARRHGVPYLLLVSSHDAGPKPGWRRAVKSTVVPRVVRPAAGALVLGSLAADSLVAHGLSPEKIWRFANTIDVVDWGRQVDALAPLRDEIRASLGAGRSNVIVLSVGRLSPEKGLDTLIDALAAIGDPSVRLVVAGTGDERQALEKRAAAGNVTATFLGSVPWEQLREVYAAADVFALLSRHEPWGVVVNEAAATGLPLVLSDRVGAAHDLVREGENGYVVPADDPRAAADALRPLVVDAKLRRVVGDAARELIAEWGYEPSVENFVAAVRAATVPA